MKIEIENILLIIAAATAIIFAFYRQKQKANKNLAESFKNIEIISKMGVKMTSTLNLSESINVIYEYLNSVMDAKGFSIYIYNSNNRCLELKYALENYKYVNKESISIDSENSFAVWCVKNNEVIFINDVKTEYSKYVKEYYWATVDSPDVESVKSFINVPLSIKGEIVGMVSIHSFQINAYTKFHKEIFKSLSAYIAVALNNAEAYSQLNSAKVLLTEQKKLVEEKNKDITDSINYAKRIQQAKLPILELIYSHLPQSFVLFKPKDIVSGDFYFFHKINSQSAFIAAADCTGHGVPGAFMSMIGTEQLNNAVAQDKNTSEILNQLNKGMKTSLRQSDSAESTRDGMDIALCSVDTINRVVKFAGANRPIWLIRKGHTSVEEVKATKKAIGGLTDDDQYFDTHELILLPGDTFYISTDGYADQFSGEGKKLTTKMFKQILVEIQNKTMQEQGLHLDTFIDNWKSGTEQIDDILVIGVRL